MATRYLNIESAVWTDANPTSLPQGGQSVITFLGCQSLTVGDGSTLLKGMGDGDGGPSTVVMDHYEPVMGLKFEDISPLALQGFSGRSGSLVVQLGRASGTGVTTAGGVTFQLAPAVALVKGMSAGYRKFSDCDIEFHGVLVQGQNPLKVTQTAS